MLVLVALVVLQAQAAPPAPTATLEHRSRPHCTLAGEDLAHFVTLPDMCRWSGRHDVPPYGARHWWDVADCLWKRHRFGHGDWDETTTATLIEFGSVPCDAVGLRVIVQAAQAAVSSRDFGPGTEHVARILELNGDFESAEALFRKRIEADPEKPDPYLWRDYAMFLARRGRFEEALVKFESAPPITGLCGLSLDTDTPRIRPWVELCSRELCGNLSRADQWEARKRSAPPSPGGESFSIYERIEFTRAPQRLVYDQDEIVRRIASGDYKLNQIADSGFPVAGHLVLDFVGDSEQRRGDVRRQLLFERWRDGVWRRTFGRADPEDPTTW